MTDESNKLETYSQFADLVKMFAHMMSRGKPLPPDVVIRLAFERAPDPKTGKEWADTFLKEAS